jgi:hypothetical protein
MAGAEAGRPFDPVVACVVTVECYIAGAEARLALHPDEDDRTFTRDYLARQFGLERESLRVFRSDGVELAMHHRRDDFVAVLVPPSSYYVVGEIDRARLTMSRTAVDSRTSVKPARQAALQEIIDYKVRKRYPARVRALPHGQERTYAMRAFRKRAADYQLANDDGSPHLVRLKVSSQGTRALPVLTDPVEVRACSRARAAVRVRRGLILTPPKIESAIKRVHNNGHLGRDETTRLVCTTYDIPNTKERVAQYIATCPACQVRTAQMAPRMQMFIYTTEPFEMVRFARDRAVPRALTRARARVHAGPVRFDLLGRGPRHA